jgi:SAM-dependent methyltransferase
VEQRTGRAGGGYVNNEAASRSGEFVGFSFGANWQKLIGRLSQEQVQHATDSVASSFGSEQVAGRRFVDVGCGSGLFSLGALKLGASQVVSIDVDPNAIACATELKRKEGNPANWAIRAGSILDASFIRTFEPADLVFSWGVIHHTGAMWTAFENLLLLVRPSGLLRVAIYNRPRKPGLQLALKRSYNRAPRRLRPLMVAGYGSVLLTLLAVNGRNPVRYVSEYGSRSRGMDFWRDVEDWLGGLPFEYASPDEVRKFAENSEFQVEDELVRSPGGCNEYLLRRMA